MSGAEKTKNLLNSAIMAGLAAMTAKLIGFAREVVLAAFYGTGTVSDAFILAFSIPDIFMYFISASVAAAVIAMYHRVKDATLFLRNIMTCLLFLGMVISTVFSIFPRAIVSVFAFQASTEVFEMAVYFTRFFIWSVVFVLFIELYNAYLEIKGKFFSSGIRTIWRNGLVIVGLVLSVVLDNKLFMAVAPIAGTAVCMISLASSSKKLGYSYKPYFNFLSQDLKAIFPLILPMFISLASTEINMIVAKNFAASLPVGAISALSYSGKVQGLFTLLIGQAVFVVLFPHMSKLAADNDMDKLKKTLAQGVTGMATVLLPVCAGVYFLAEPCVRILFQRGAFTPEDTINTAGCLKMYALMIGASSINSLVMRAFYAIRDTKIPAKVSFAMVFINIVLNIVFIGPFGAKGLALAASLVCALTAVTLLILLRRKLGSLMLGEYVPEIVKCLAAFGVTAAGLWFAERSVPFMNVSTVRCIIFIALTAAGAALVYAALLFAMKSRILSYIIKSFKHKSVEG